MGVTAGHSADDEANVLRQMSLRPLNTELSSETSRLFVRELQGVATVYAFLWMWGVWTSPHIIEVSTNREEGFSDCVHGNVMAMARIQRHYTERHRDGMEMKW